MTDSYNKFKSTTIYGNLINDTSGTYIANALFKGNVGFNGNINLGSSNSNIYKYDGTLLGQKGDTGPQGDVGPSGYITLGRTGLTGPTGSTGSTGYKGPTGDNGLFGDKGSTGYKGPTGDNGVTGNKGQTGNNGVTGDNGPTGNKGPNGDIGTFSGTIVDLTSTGNITATNLDISGTIHTPYAKLLTGSTITSSYSGSFVEVQQGTGSSITLFDPTTIGLYKNPNASINIYNGTGSNLTISSSSGSVSNGDFSSHALGQDITYGYTTSSTSQTITSWFNQNVFFSNGYGSLRDQLGTYNDLISKPNQEGKNKFGGWKKPIDLSQFIIFAFYHINQNKSRVNEYYIREIIFFNFCELNFLILNISQRRV